MRIWMFILILLRLLGESEVRCLWNRMRMAIQTRYITFRPSNMKQSITRTFYAKRINHLHHSLWFTNWFTKCWNGSSLKMQFSHCWWTDSTILFSPACLARYETADFCIKRNKENIEKKIRLNVQIFVYVLQRDVDTKSSTFSRWFQNATWSAWWISFS